MISQHSESLIRITWSNVFFYALVGVLIYTFSLNGLLRKIAGDSESFISQVLRGLATIPDQTYDLLPGSQYFLFELLVRWLIISVAIFLVLLFLNSLRFKSAAVFISGISGLMTGIFLFTWVTVLLFIIFIIFAIVSWLFEWISFLLSIVFSAILAVILWSPIFYGLIGLGILFTIIWLLSNFEDIWNQILGWLESIFNSEGLINKILFSSLAIVTIIGAFYVLVKVWKTYLAPLFEIIINWLRVYVVPLLEWIIWLIGMLLLIAVVTVFVCLTLVVLGYQYCDQFYTARNCGKSTHRAFDTGFGIGVPVALILLICSANSDYRLLFNEAWNYTAIFSASDLIGLIHILMPSEAEVFLQSLFVKASIPIFDAFSLVIALFLANCSLIMSLTSGTIQEPIRGLLKVERMPLMFLLMFGALIMIATPIINAIFSDD